MSSRTTRALVGAALALTGCTAVLGVNDVFYDPGAPQGVGSDAAGGDGATPRGDGGPGGGDAACSSDLQTDAKNCGRCGHDCVGGACKGGACEPVELASIGRPVAVAVDDANLYVTSLTDGLVMRLDKATGKQAQKIADVPRAFGVALTSSPSRLWLTGDATKASGGGLFACTPPDCADKVPVGTLGNGHQLAVDGTTVFVASADGVFRVTSPTDAPFLISSGVGQPYAVAGDKMHAYYTSLAIDLRRTQLDGGAKDESVGPLSADTNYAFVAVDATRFYWAYVDSTSKKGQVLGALKANPTTRTVYTSNGAGSAGIAVDATYVYWSDDGTSPTAGDGTVNACPLAGCPASGPVVLARNLRGSGPIAQDATALYFVEFGTTDADGRVRKVAKP